MVEGSCAGYTFATKGEDYRCCGTRADRFLRSSASVATGCATTGEQTFFDRSSIVHPEALFDVASRSAKLRQYEMAALSGRNGDRLCIREKDLVDLGAADRPLARGGEGRRRFERRRSGLRARRETSAPAAVASLTTEARREGISLRCGNMPRPAPRLVPKPSWTNASGVINAMGALICRHGTSFGRRRWQPRPIAQRSRPGS